MYRGRTTSNPYQTRWRESNNYREAHFRASPGLYGTIWFCSICSKPLIGKSNVEADHIIPPSRFVVKRRDGRVVSELMAKALNTGINTTGICRRCNAKKGNKMGYYTVKGAVAKTRETTARGIGDTAALGVSLAFLMGEKILDWATRPIRSKRVGTTFKVAYILVCVIIIFILFHRRG